MDLLLSSGYGDEGDDCDVGAFSSGEDGASEMHSQFLPQIGAGGTLQKKENDGVAMGGSSDRGGRSATRYASVDFAEEQGSRRRRRSQKRVIRRGRRSEGCDGKRPRVRGCDGGDNFRSPRQFARSVPHVRGQWAGHVSLVLDGPHSSVLALERAALRVTEGFRRDLGTGCTVVSHISEEAREASDSNGSSGGDSSGSESDETDDEGQISEDTNYEQISTRLHVSLSRPFFLPLPSIDTYVSDLRLRLPHYRPFPLTLDMNEAFVLTNDDRTRSFLCLPVMGPGRDSAVKLIREVDASMERFGLPIYYKEARLHVSIASVAGDVTNLLAGKYGIQDTPGSRDSGGNMKGICLNRRCSEEKIEVPRQGSVLVVCESVTFMVKKILCTFGTTKQFVITLSQ